MLAGRELGWLPLAPLLLAQGLYARLATARLPPATGASGRTGNGPSLRLAGLGDSIIAGIGVSRHEDSLIGQVARLVAAQGGRSVQWRAVGRSGATSAVILQELLPLAVEFRPQLVILSVGVNDAVRGVPADAFRQRLAAIVDALAQVGQRPAVVFAGIPPLAAFPALPWPLSRLLGGRAALLQQAAAGLAGHGGMQVVTFPASLDRSAFSRDGFHPGEAACAVWAEWVVAALSPPLDAAEAGAA